MAALNSGCGLSAAAAHAVGTGYSDCRHARSRRGRVEPQEQADRATAPVCGDEAIVPIAPVPLGSPR
jgi:hypothetical protein